MSLRCKFQLGFWLFFRWFFLVLGVWLLCSRLCRGRILFGFHLRVFLVVLDEVVDYAVFVSWVDYVG